MRERRPIAVPKSYTPLPRLSGLGLLRLRAVVEVLSGEQTVSGAARKLGLSRNHFQSLMHRGLRTLGESLAPRRAGRPPVPARERQLLEENRRLRSESERLKKRVDTANRVLELLRGFLGTHRRLESRSERGSLTAEDE